MSNEGSERSEEPDLAEAVAAFVRQLPADSVITWGDDGSEDQPVLTPWLDVWAPDIARPVGLNWVWVVNTPDSFETSDIEGSSPPPGPLDIILPPDATTDAGEPGWSIVTLNRVLEEWVLAHTCRDDIRFVYDPDLYTDWARDAVERFKEPSSLLAEDPDGRLHDVAENGSALWTSCGIPVGSDWLLVCGDLEITDEMSDEEFDWELDRRCAVCAGRAFPGT